MTWLVVHTKALAEEQAAEQLANQGYTVFLPRIRERKRRQNRWQWVTSPLFSRYLFVDVPLGEQNVAPIRSTIGVSALVRFGQALATIPDSLIDHLRSEQSEVINAKQGDKASYQSGDRVEILEGPFAGLAGIYQARTGEERALVLINLLGRQNSLVVQEEGLGHTL